MRICCPKRDLFSRILERGEKIQERDSFNNGGIGRMSAFLRTGSNSESIFKYPKKNVIYFKLFRNESLIPFESLPLISKEIRKSE